MSPTTLNHAPYEIREGRTGGEPCIEGVVDGQAAVIAFRSSGAFEKPTWFLAVYTEVAATAGTPHPVAARIHDDEQARHWVELLTALYAAAVAEEPDNLLSVEALRAISDELPREVGNSAELSDLAAQQSFRR